jgi:hypothetical protein
MPRTMPASAAERDWLRSAAGLTVSSNGRADLEGLDTAETMAAHLVEIAAALPRCPVHDGGHPDPHAGPQCRFADRQMPERFCRLAARLADLSGTAPARPATTPGLFLEALRATVSAVYLCRRVGHTSGTCWFDAQGQPDLCGQVLAVAHLL